MPKLSAPDPLTLNEEFAKERSLRKMKLLLVFGGLAAVIFIIAIFSLSFRDLFFHQLYQRLPGLAWQTGQSAGAVCNEAGGIDVIASFTNTEPIKDYWCMHVVATDLQTNQSVNMGDVSAGETATSTIHIDQDSISAGQVRFYLTWCDGRSGDDTRTASYTAIGCEVTVTPTPLPTPSNVPTPSPSDAPTPSPSIAISPTPTLTGTPIPTPSILPTPTVLPQMCETFPRHEIWEVDVSAENPSHIYEFKKPNALLKDVEVIGYWKWDNSLETGSIRGEGSPLVLVSPENNMVLGESDVTQTNEEHRVITPLGTITCRDYGDGELAGLAYACGSFRSDWDQDSIFVTVEFTGDSSSSGVHGAMVEVRWCCETEPEDEPTPTPTAFYTPTPGPIGGPVPTVLTPTPLASALPVSGTTSNSGLLLIGMLGLIGLGLMIIRNKNTFS